ncbi:MAG TPA: hypothetical protein VEF89_11540 [Solirubrobacteraceae bacterium]|nr:hypothetical protein [Solirubrobacteraceae bacterium]
MERSSSASALRTQVELALLGGRNLEPIETELLTRSHLDKDEQTAVWLYAWSRGAASSPPVPAGIQHAAPYRS